MPSFISFYEPGLAYVASAKIDALTAVVRQRDTVHAWHIRWQIEETFPLNIYFRSGRHAKVWELYWPIGKAAASSIRSGRMQIKSKLHSEVGGSNTCVARHH